VTVCSLSHDLFSNGTEVFHVDTNSTEVVGYRWTSSEQRRSYLTRGPDLLRAAYLNGSFVMTVIGIEKYGPGCITNITVNNHGDSCPSDPNKTEPGLCGCGVSDSVIGHACGTGHLGVCAVGVIQCSGGHQFCAQTNAASTEVCDGLDNDCDGAVDNDVPSTTCGSDVGECSAGTTQCVSGSIICQNAVGPAVETCDGLDNDCNNVVDDIPADACGSDVGECSAGTTQCLNNAVVCANSVGPTPEGCDNLDNDCNGQIDDGIASVVCGSDVGECSSGTTSCISGNTVCLNEVAPSAEACDGLDNDCNGVVDDNVVFDPSTCGVSVGACSIGTMECSNGMSVCVGATFPVAEICNGIDDDCDGVVDDNIQSAACGSDVGECVSGTTTCSSGSTTCVNAVGPTAEVCDGLDNDCDGQIDNGVAYCVNGTLTCIPQTEVCDGIDNDCNGLVDDSITSVACGSDVGECVSGMTQCSAGATVCVGSVGPVSEVCNGLDDDCNGVADDVIYNSNPCPTDHMCAVGTPTCNNGSLQCVNASGPYPDLGQNCSLTNNQCVATGTYVCQPDNSGVYCDAVIVETTCTDAGISCGSFYSNCGNLIQCTSGCETQGTSGSPTGTLPTGGPGFLPINP
jgi:hypothetical protein